MFNFMLLLWQFMLLYCFYFLIVNNLTLPRVVVEPAELADVDRVLEINRTGTAASWKK